MDRYLVYRPSLGSDEKGVSQGMRLRGLCFLPAVHIHFSQIRFRPDRAAGVGTDSAGPVTLQGTASEDLSGLSRIQVSVDGRPWRAVSFTGTGSPPVTWSYTWDDLRRLTEVEAPSPWSHKVQYAYDANGNVV